MSKVIKPRKPAKATRGPKKKFSFSQMTIGDIGSLLMEAAGAVRYTLNAEVKRFDLITGGFAPGAGGNVSVLSLVTLGDDYNNRDGHSLRTVALEARWSYQMNAAAVSDLLRVIIFADMECAGAAPTVATVLEGANPLSLFQHDNVGRFVVLHDQLIDTSAVRVTMEGVIKLPLDVHIKYQSAAGTVADCREGNLFVLTVAREAVNTGTFSLISRLSFLDN